MSIAVEAERAGGHCGLDVRPQKDRRRSAAIVEAAALDAYSRLIHPSLENELRAELTAKAAEGAITVFGENLRQLLLQPPIRGKTVMGLDPGYRMGCKVAVVDPDRQGAGYQRGIPGAGIQAGGSGQENHQEHGAEKARWRLWPSATAPPGMKSRGVCRRRNP